MLMLKLHKSNEKYGRFLNELISSRWTRHQFYISFSYKLSRIIDHWAPMDETYDIPRSTTFSFDDENQNYHIGNNKNNSRLTNVWYRSYKWVLSYKIKLYNVDIPLPVCFFFFLERVKRKRKIAKVFLFFSLVLLALKSRDKSSNKTETLKRLRNLYITTSLRY